MTPAGCFNGSECFDLKINCILHYWKKKEWEGEKAM